MAQQGVGLAADRGAGEEVVEEEEGGHLAEAGEQSGQRGHLFLGVQVQHGPLELLRVAGVLPAQLGDPRLERRAGALAAGRRPGQGVDEESYDRREQDDRGGRGGRAEQWLEQVGEVLDQGGENGHG